MKIKSILLALAVIVFFVACVSRLESGREAQGKQQLEEAVRRTVVTCYSVDGFYPPSVQYMQENYGLQYDEKKYVIRYDVFASNLMPEITVLEK